MARINLIGNVDNVTMTEDIEGLINDDNVEYITEKDLLIGEYDVEYSDEDEEANW